MSQRVHTLDVSLKIEEGICRAFLIWEVYSNCGKIRQLRGLAFGLKTRVRWLWSWFWWLWCFLPCSLWSINAPLKELIRAYFLLLSPLFSLGKFGRCAFQEIVLTVDKLWNGLPNGCRGCLCIKCFALFIFELFNICAFRSWLRIWLIVVGVHNIIRTP